ncbi:MAG: phosphotransferase [Planctomycetes bacterium]|nr:phosphotransferase [Planctomycetota bacterium]
MADRPDPGRGAPLTAPAGFEAADGGAVVVRAAARARLEALGLTTVDGAFALPAAPRAQAGGRYKALAQVVDAGGRLFVKRWDYDRLEVWLRGALKWNFPVFSGRRELDNLLALAAAGLRVPAPLAAGERTRGLRRRAFLVTCALEGAPLDRAPPPATARERFALVREVAALAARLHGAGFWHKDLYLGNVVRGPDGRLGLLDCERVERRPGGPPLRWRVKDLAALDLSAAWATRADRARFLRAYLGRPRLDPDARRLAAAARRKSARMRRRGAKW